MKKRDKLFWIFAVIQAIVVYIFGIIWLYPGTNTLSGLNPLTFSQFCLIILIVSTVGIEYLIYSKK